MKASIVLAVVALWCASCGTQGSMIYPSYIGEAQGIASQLMGMASQVQSYRLQEEQLQRQPLRNGQP